MKNKNCILVFIANVDKWGAERSVCSLCKFLQANNERVIVIIPRKGGIIELLEDSGIEYSIIPYSLRIRNANEKISPRRFLRRLINHVRDICVVYHRIKEMGVSPKLVYSATLNFCVGIEYAHLISVPHVQHIRENIDAFGYKFIWGYKNTMKYISKNSVRIICTCNTILNRYLADVDSSKIEAIYNGTPIVKEVPVKIIGDMINIIHIARYMEDKRIMDSLQAVRILIHNGISNIHLDIYGSGPDESKYKDYILKNNLSDFITLKGFVSSIDYAPYHIGLMTSTFEAFARSTLDYMNNGLAVIASNTGGNIEQVVNGVTGLLYEVHNPHDLAKQMECLCLNHAEILRMGANGRERYLANFTQEKYVSSVGGRILSILKNGNL